TAVETGTAQSAREKTGKSGSQTGKRNCFRCPTSMSCSHCPTNSTDWPCTGPKRHMTASSRRHGEPWTALPKTPATWVQKPTWSPSCIPGDSSSVFTRTCTASCREEDSPNQENGKPPEAKANFFSPSKP